MELNGLQNLLVTVTQLHDDNKIDDQEFNKLQNQILQVADYLRAYEQDPTIYWHEFIAMEGNDTTFDWAAQGIDPDESQE